MILNGLGFVSAPLYLFGQFFQGKATEQLLGEGIKPEQLNDDRLGNVLDELYAGGLSELFVEISLAAVNKFEINTETAHLDSTSFHVDGSYEKPEPGVIEITHGYSRDHRPDLKQFMMNLICVGDGDIPVLMEIASGNQSDKARFAQLFQEFRHQWTFEGLCVADGALYSADNLTAMAGLRWLTRVPLSIKAAATLWHQLSALDIIEKPHYDRAGKPRKDAVPTRISYHVTGTVVAIDSEIAAQRVRCGRFILASNVLDLSQLSADDALREYKAQQGVERGFGFLKDPLFFTSSVFLKSPKRIAALGMIMALCLLVYNLGQRQLRQALTQSQATIPNQLGQPTTTPTLRWVFQCFMAVHLVVFQGVQQVVNLTDERQHILRFFCDACRRYYLLPVPPS
jgi:transposase